MSQIAPPAVDALPASEPACENCGTALQGHYCHACGQSAHSPIRSFAHAVEEVFESFWHLDGRIFRTLRDLWVPGRVARNYLAGHRVRYIAPLRLFVILSLLTFFVGKLVLHVDGSAIAVGDDGAQAITGFRNAQMDAARTEAQVRAIEQRALADLEVAERKAAGTPGVVPMLVATRVQVQGAAATRIAALREGARKPAPATTGKDTQAGAADPTPTGAASSDATARAATAAASPAASTDGDANAEEDGALVLTGEDGGPFVCRFNNTPFDPVNNPVDSPLLPAFADGWLNARIAKACANAQRISTDADSVFQAVLGAVPTALFLLMPVFALLLKLVYLGSGRGYLEHLVVALYSHAFLLLMLMALFLLGTVGDTAPAWLRVGSGVLTAAVWIWLPVYLLWMQKRVYGDGWLLTLVRCFVIGQVYLLLVGFAAVYAALLGLSS